MVDATIQDVSLRGEGNGIAVAEWATAVLNNGVGDYQTAMTAAQRATDHPGEMRLTDLGGGRAHRGRRAQREKRNCSRGPSSARRGYQCQWHRIGRSVLRLVRGRC